MTPEQERQNPAQHSVAAGGANMDALLVAEGLSVRYPAGVTALDQLNLVIPDSGITCLVGANGAGKTTLLETAAGLQAPSAGALRVRGQVPGSKQNRLHIGVMLQDGGMPGSVRAQEFVSYVGQMYPHPRDPVELLKQVEIDPNSRTPIRRLSGGEQRRVAWAAAMVGDATSLFLDEPTAGLDPVGRERLYEVLRTERDRGVSMIVSTHLIEDVESLADFIVVLHAGRVVLTGEPAQLRPSNALLVRSARAMDEQALLTALPQGSGCYRITDDVYRVNVPAGIDPSVMATVSSWCNQHSVTPDVTVADLKSVLWGALRGEQQT